jgi:hypothetical protein
MPDISPSTPILTGAAGLSCAVAAELSPQSNIAKAIENWFLDIDVPPEALLIGALFLAAKVLIGWLAF